MATFTSIFVPAKDGTGTAAGTSASTGVTLGNNILFAINSTSDLNIVFYNAANPKVPTAANFRIPANMVAVYDLSQYYDSFAVYNASGSSITFWWQVLCRN